MSRDFPGSGVNDLTRTQGFPWDSYTNPVAFGAWVYRDSSVEVCVATSGWRNTFGRSWIVYIPTSGIVNLADLDSGLSGHGATKSGFTNNAWHHVGWEWTGSVIRVYLDGVAGSDVAQTGAFNASNTEVLIGSSRRDSAARYMDGAICDACVWNDNPSAAEWLALAKGVPARMIRPGKIAAWEPIWGVGSDEPDLSGGGKPFTIEGTLIRRDHAPLGCPFPLAA